MKTPVNCAQNTDPLKLAREGTSQEQRLSPALDPTYVPINERKPEHWMVFAKAYSKYLKHFNSEDNTADDDWTYFFSKDVSVLLAFMAVQDVDYYKNKVKEAFNFLNNRENAEKDLKAHLGYLFSYVGTLASQLETLKEGLPDDILLKEVVALKEMLQNLVINQLAPLYRRLLSYYKADLELDISQRLVADSRPDHVILGGQAAVFSTIYRIRFSKDWITDNSTSWNAYREAITAIPLINGSGSVFNHIATHNLFTLIFDQFLKTYSRVVDEARHVLEATFKWDGHQPHYALFLAFLKLFEQASTETNTLTKRHLDLYYREILRLKEKPAEPSHAHLLVELAKHVDSHELKTDELFKAGKDDLGIEAFFANDRDFVPNQAKVGSLKTVYRHKNAPNDSLDFQDGRLFASQVSNSDDGLGAELTSVDQSWHPFFNKIYKNGKLERINMPEAEVGFAIASHYLWLAEGKRTIKIDFTVDGTVAGLPTDLENKIVCLFTTEKGWIEKTALKFIRHETEPETLYLEVELTGGDPAITPYLLKTHGYNFDATLPILLIKLKHDKENQENQYAYNDFQDIVITKIDIKVEVGDLNDTSVPGLKTLAISNDFGPVDTSKPFQPFGASPKKNSAVVIGSKEAFQKELETAVVNITWQNAPNPYGDENKTVPIEIQYLQSGIWEEPSDITVDDITKQQVNLGGSLSFNQHMPFVNLPDFSELEYYSTSSKHGFIRLNISTDFGQSEYEQALIIYIREVVGGNLAAVKPVSPVGPFVQELTLNYTSIPQTITLNSNKKLAFETRQSHFFHVTPFGLAEQHSYLKKDIPSTNYNIADQSIYLFPPLKHLNAVDSRRPREDSVQHEAEFYIGIAGLKPPQNITLLFQVSDGTADPLSDKPDPHIHWSYLCANEWLAFAENEVEDLTNGLINSGIITFAMPRNASADNTLLPAGMHWIRAAVESESDTVCRLLRVAAQALRATFVNKGNDPAFSAKTLTAGTISKLEQPDANIKKIDQPFASFGGRGKERSEEFYTRISERLRHKDRGIALWDYERLILETFPQIYKVKCLNHTHYGTDDNGSSIYKELAPGHITIVTLPNQQFHNQRDPLKPYTSLGLLKEIEVFLTKRLSCFVKLHVKNPQFEEVNVDCKVGLHDNSDKTYYENKLQEAITRFLSPWAFSDATGPSFGGKIYKSVLINFVEDLPYVDYVTDFQLFHSVIVNEKLEKSEKNEVEGSKPISILVSAPKHKITAINPAEEETPRESCRYEL
jgi:baseplate J-like protein